MLTFPAGFSAQNNLVQLDLECEQAYWADIPGWCLRVQESEPAAGAVADAVTPP